MSSSGILFSTREQIQVGWVMEVSVTWPARLEGTCQLKLVAVGRVVRSAAQWAAMRIERYEFRTRSSIALQSTACAAPHTG